MLHAWGMTEMSPLGTVVHASSEASASCRRRSATRCTHKQGRPIYGVDMRIVDEDGAELPWDGSRLGDLQVRGPWVVKGYFKGEGGERQFARRRLVPDRRRRHHRRRRLHADHRPLEGRDQVGRRMDQLDRPGERRHGASGRRRGRGDRRRAPEVGRAAAAGRGRRSRAGVSPRRSCSGSTRARSPSGGCPTTWCSSRRCRTPPPARS